MIDPAAVIAELTATLDALRTEGRVDIVAVGVGLGVPQTDRLALVWFDGEADEQETLANVMTDYRFSVALCWLVRSAASAQDDVEVEMMATLRRAKELLRAASSLGGLVTDLKLTPAQRFVGPLTDMVAATSQVPIYHQLRFDVIVSDLEGEVISG